MRYYVIGDEHTVLGFGMAGVTGRAVGNQEETEEALREAAEEKDIGIIIITERLADLVRPQVDRLMFTQAFPLIVEIPDREGRLEGKPGLREMVNQAIGVRV
jgi:V/A-type H+-transporting ATPase subunit F